MDSTLKASMEMKKSISIRTCLENLVDPGTLTSIPTRTRAIDPLEFDDGNSYKHRLAQSLEESSGDESVSTFLGLIDGKEVALVGFDFSFLGGTMGVVAGERIYQVFDLASKLGVPVISWIRTGGARMQEGALAFMQMSRVVSGLVQHRQAGQISISYLDNPTTGGVLASFGSLADRVIARPGALVGFSGPRVAMALLGRYLNPSSQRAETLQLCGIVDDLCEPEDLRDLISAILSSEPIAIHPSPGSLMATPESSEEARSILLHDLKACYSTRARSFDSSWEAVEFSRQAGRANIDDLAFSLDSQARPLVDNAKSSVGAYEICLDGEKVGLLGFRADPNLRVTCKDLSILRRLGLSLSRSVTGLLFMIDTYGAEVSEEAEQQGLAREVARNIQTLLNLPIPTVTLLAGQGSGGAAMALMASDVVLSTEDSWLAPLAPEAAAAVMKKSANSCADLANWQRIDSRSLESQGVVDAVLPISLTDSIENVSAVVVGAFARSLASLKIGAGTFRFQRLERMNEKALLLGEL